MYVIEDGLVGLYLELGPMTHRQIQAASNFDVIAWSAMLPPYRSTTTAKAIETTKALVFHGTDGAMSHRAAHRLQGAPRAGIGGCSATTSCLYPVDGRHLTGVIQETHGIWR